MKANMHPEMHLVTAVCACGNTFQTHTTKKELRLEICSACHPYFTGKQKLVDTAGRVERFQKRYMKGAPAVKATSASA
jgi:large subunit ribosomal protein L31